MLASARLASNLKCESPHKCLIINTFEWKRIWTKLQHSIRALGGHHAVQALQNPPTKCFIIPMCWLWIIIARLLSHVDEAWTNWFNYDETMTDATGVSFHSLSHLWLISEGSSTNICHSFIINGRLYIYTIHAHQHKHNNVGMSALTFLIISY